MKKILIFTYLHRHLKKLVPIIKELQCNKKIDLTVLLMTSEERVLAEQSCIEYRMLDEFTEDKRGSDFDLGWGLEPLINAIDRIEPDLFLAIEVNYILRNAVRYCKQKGIKSLVVQHGTPNEYSLHAFAPFEADCFAAWGDFSKNFLVEHGVDPRKIVLTGGAVFDKTRSIVPNREAIAKEIGVDLAKKWIVFTTQGVGAGGYPSQEEIVDAVEGCVKASMEQEGYQLILQVHPSQSIEDIVKMVEAVPGSSAVVCKYRYTEELMAASCAVITFFSTTAIDAVIMGKPLLLINLTEDRGFLPFAKMDAAISAYDKSEIESKFGELLSPDFFTSARKDGVDNVANYVNYMNDGGALNRIIDLILNKLQIQQ